MSKSKHSSAFLRNFLFIILATIILLGSYKLINLTQVQCQLENQPSCPEELTAKLENDFQKWPLLFRDWQKLLAVHPAIVGRYRVTSLKLNLPNQLLIMLEPEPFVYQILMGDSEYFSITQFGVAQKTNKTEDLPLVILQKKTELENDRALTSNQTHLQLVSLLKSLELADIKFARVELTDNDLATLQLKTGKKALLSLSNSQADIEKLRLILNSDPYQENQTEIKEVDLRFSLPVLRN